MLNKAEGRVSTWIKREFGLEAKDGKAKIGQTSSALRLGEPYTLSNKARGVVAHAKDVLQADKYRKYVLKRFSEITDAKAIKYAIVQSHLISAELHDDAGSLKDAYADKGWCFLQPGTI